MSKWPKYGYKLRRRTDGKFFRKNGSRFVWNPETESCDEISHDEAHYHNNALGAHLYPTIEKAIASIGNGYGWSSKHAQPIEKEEDILDLEIVPAVQYKDHIEFGVPIETYWLFEQIKEHYGKYT